MNAQTQQSSDSRYETSQLNLAAYLMASGASELVDTRSAVPGSKTMVFVFSPAPSQGVVESFFNGSAQVSAIAYHNAVRNIRSAMREAGRSCSEVHDERR